MFTRRMFFKILAAIGAGSLFSAESEGTAAQWLNVSAASSTGHLARPGDTYFEVPAQAFGVTTTEQWENLLDDLDAVELIGRYVSLTSAPDEVSRLTGRCPFCRHGADSLLVDSRDDTYLCTDCLAGGHALDFYARMEGLSLPESLRSVGKLMAAGVLQGKRPRLKRFHCIIEAIDRFAHESLICSREGASARGWLNHQGITAEMVEKFSLGMMPYALSDQLLERLRAVGFTPDELEQAGVDGWMSCLADRFKAGESNSTLLLPVRDREGDCCGFYEQSFGLESALAWSSHVVPYGYQLLAPHRANQLVYCTTSGQTVPSSVVLVEHPWDVVLLAQEGLHQAVYVSPLDLHEYHDRFNRFLLQVQRGVWPIYSSDLSVEFMRNLCRLSPHGLERVAFLFLPDGTGFSEWLRREGPVIGRARLEDALSATELLRF
ncbi:MAG: hypothetical protein KF747_18490 [Nitrospira sp.]|nr:hypothetical protein [Nitrospira sp.]